MTIFSEKIVFFEKNMKNCFGSTHDNILGKEGMLRKFDAKYFHVK